MCMNTPTIVRENTVSSKYPAVGDKWNLLHQQLFSSKYKTINLEITQVLTIPGNNDFPLEICPVQYIVYYNMTGCILEENYISFTIAVGLIRLHMPGVKKSRV